MIVSVCLCIYEMYVRVNVSWKNCGYPSIVNANLVLLPQLVRENSQSWLPHFWPHFADLLVKSRVHFPLFFVSWSIESEKCWSLFSSVSRKFGEYNYNVGTRDVIGYCLYVWWNVLLNLSKVITWERLAIHCIVVFSEFHCCELLLCFFLAARVLIVALKLE